MSAPQRNSISKFQSDITFRIKRDLNPKQDMYILIWAENKEIKKERMTLKDNLFTYFLDCQIGFSCLYQFQVYEGTVQKEQETIWRQFKFDEYGDILQDEWNKFCIVYRMHAAFKGFFREVGRDQNCKNRNRIEKFNRKYKSERTLLIPQQQKQLNKISIIRKKQQYFQYVVLQKKIKERDLNYFICKLLSKYLLNILSSPFLLTINQQFKFFFENLLLGDELAENFLQVIKNSHKKKQNMIVLIC